MKIGIIGHLKHPIAKPFAGGLESFTDSFVRCLVSRGHDVTLFASGDSDPSHPLSSIIERSTIADSHRRLGRVHHEWIESVEDESYERLMMNLSGQSFDVIHNHSLNPIPLRFAAVLPVPLVTTLHAPPLVRMVDELRNRSSERCGRFINISKANADAWSPWVDHQDVIHNGVDTLFWNAPGQSRLVRAIWFGRILPDKGTHLAIAAAEQAGIALDVVGPVSDEQYFDREVRPRLSQRIRYLGHRDHDELSHLISRSAVALVTPCWDEPFGLVVAEALACGTPVAGFARGALPEIIDPSVGCLAEPDDIPGLADSIRHCLTLSAERCRMIAEERFSFDRMIDQYLKCYGQAAVYEGTTETTSEMVAEIAAEIAA
ncbi:glycosyltransferase family 4 protein [Neorhodopirellula pilleata]|uniref:Glycogen synthase n=1 Tax=Neorhodopirellula pilleata TaxID=2714738 RepID=A0A5C6A5K0_9BACT|nr:glycosyltransferase family 4 protein [Neorhodopirellula pilleata]TWT93613.1 Glycogen synthase [Neorhodopirellula pilleata]